MKGGWDIEMEILSYIYKLYMESELLIGASILNLWQLYYAVTTNYYGYSSFMLGLKIWYIIVFFFHINIFVFMPYIGSLQSGILWEVLFGLNVLTLIYIGKRREWTFEDVKAKDGKKVLSFLVIYIGVNLYWMWLLYKGIEIWFYYAFP